MSVREFTKVGSVLQLDAGPKGDERANDFSKCHGFEWFSRSTRATSDPFFLWVRRKLQEQADSGVKPICVRVLHRMNHTCQHTTPLLTSKCSWCKTHCRNLSDAFLVVTEGSPLTMFSSYNLVLTIAINIVHSGILMSQLTINLYYLIEQACRRCWRCSSVGKVPAWHAWSPGFNLFPSMSQSWWLMPVEAGSPEV